MYFLFMLVACLCGPCITHGMLTFILPWLPPLALPSQIIGRTSSRSGATPAKSDCWCFSTPFGQDHADPRWHVGAGGACGPLAPSDDSLRRRRLRRRRTATYLGSAVGGNEEHDTGAFHPVRGIEVDGRSNVELLARLKAMGRRFEWRGALKVFRRAKAEGLVADNNVYSCIIGVMAKSGRWSEAVELLEQARNDGLEPNKYCFTAAVSSCAKGRNGKLALSLLEEMRASGLRPDHVTYGSAVNAMAKTGQWQRALNLLHQMAEEGLQPNVVCYGAAVDACAKGGQWERAVALLEEMRAAGVEPDRICYNTAVNACAQSGEWETALSLVEKMREAGDGVRPDAFTFNSVMFAMASVGEWERLLVVLGGMQAGGVAPDVVSFNTAMGACNKARKHERTLSTFEDMQAAGVAPDKESFSAAAEACASDTSGGMGARAIELMEQARKQGLKKPAARAVAASLAACVGGGPWQMAIPAVEVMLEASGRDAWDDVMNFLADSRLRRGEMSRRRAEATRAVSPTARLPNTPPGFSVDVDADALIPPSDSLENRETPCVNGHGSGRNAGRALPPSGAGPVEDRTEESVVDAAPDAQTARTCAPLETRRFSEDESGGDEASSDDEGRRRTRDSKAARGAIAAAASFKLGCVPVLAQVIVAASSAVNGAS